MSQDQYVKRQVLYHAGYIEESQEIVCFVKMLRPFRAIDEEAIGDLGRCLIKLRSDFMKEIIPTDLAAALMDIWQSFEILITSNSQLIADSVIDGATLNMLRSRVNAMQFFVIRSLRRLPLEICVGPWVSSICEFPPQDVNAYDFLRDHAYDLSKSNDADVRDEGLAAVRILTGQTH